MITQLRKNAENDFEKDFFNLINRWSFCKVNMRKHRDIKLVTTEERRNYLLTEPNYNTTKLFSENLLPIEMKKTNIHE